MPCTACHVAQGLITLLLMSRNADLIRYVGNSRLLRSMNTRRKRLWQAPYIVAAGFVLYLTFKDEK